MAAGRPTLYRDHYPEQAYKLTLLGLTDAEMANVWDVSVETVNEWKRVHPEFSASIARGKVAADADVAVSLRQRALGYTHKAVKIFLPQGATEPVIVPYDEHYPPDTQAASLWLRNRQPAKWRDKTEVDLSGDVNIRRVISERPLTEAEWSASYSDEGKDAKR